MKAQKENWVPANNQTEVPFVSRSGKRLQYMFCLTTHKHAYYCLDTDMFLTDEESYHALMI